MFSGDEPTGIIRMVSNFDRFIGSSGRSDSSKEHIIPTRLNFSVRDDESPEERCTYDKLKSENRIKLREMEGEVVKAQTTAARLEGQVKRLETHNTHLRIESERQREKHAAEQRRNKEKIEELEAEVARMVREEEKTKAAVDDKLRMLEEERRWQDMKMQQRAATVTEDKNLAEEVWLLQQELSKLRSKLLNEQLECDRLREQQLMKEHLEETVAADRRRMEELLKQVEQLKGELTFCNNSLHEMRAALSIGEEDRKVTRVSMDKLAKFPALEKENSTLRHQNEYLSELCDKHLLREEEVITLQKQLDRAEQRFRELIPLEEELKKKEAIIKEWEAAVGQVTSSLTPSDLLSVLAEMRQRELLQTEKLGELTTRAKIAENNAKEGEKKIELLMEEIQVLEEKIKQHITDRHKSQRKLLLITKERDSYKNVLESYEMEVTTTAEAARVSSLESLLDTYRSQLETAPISSSLKEDRGASQAEVDGLRSEVKRLTEENEALEARVKEAEKGYNPTTTRILHLRDNPTAVEERKRAEQVQRLQNEINELRKGQGTSASDQLSSKEVQDLQKQVSSLELRNTRLLEASKKFSYEFREAVYLLLGYRIDTTQTNQYKLSHVYAESRNHYLIFTKSGPKMTLIETDYSASLQDLISSQLMGTHSIPVFLSSLTLDLFSQQTIVPSADYDDDDTIMLD